jgi:hypothetical protein
MSKREIQVDIYECDHVDDNGERCGTQGDREAIKECGVCGNDICITHYELSTVTVRSTREHFTYYFCKEHTDQFRQVLMDKFGDTSPVPQTGYGVTLN